MFAVMYEMEDGRVFKIYQELGEAQQVANSIACMGTQVTVFDYDLDSESFVEFYTV